MRGRRWPGILASLLDPMTYFQVVRLLHYYGYSHVRPRRRLTLGEGARIAPNVSLRNGERIVIGARTYVGERAYLWAGDESSRVTIGDDCRFGPEVFVTASDYGLDPDAKIASQARNERDVVIGNDVWLGARVFVGAGVTIGDGSVVSAGSVVTKSLPPGSVAVGVPARIVRRREDYRQSEEEPDEPEPAGAVAARAGPDVSILVVTYQCRDAARACLASLAGACGGLEAEVIVLDNASDDGTVDMVRAEFPDVRLVASPVNLGFAAGVNRAAEEARGEYLLLLNPDTVAHERAVERLVEFARSRPEAGLYGGRTLDPDGTVNPGSCWGAPTLWSLFCFATTLSSLFRGSAVFDPESLGGWKRDTVREVDIVTGCLLLVPRTLWRELGGFDTRFFMYGEDADLSLRAWAHGLRPAITPDAVVTHEIGVSSAVLEDKLLLLFRGKATLFRKHWSGPRLWLGLRFLTTGLALRSLLVLATRGPAGARASGWPQAWRRRREWLPGYPATVEPAAAPAPAPELDAA